MFYPLKTSKSMIYFIALFVPFIVTAIILVSGQLLVAWDFARKAERISRDSTIGELVDKELEQLEYEVKKVETEVLDRFDEAEKGLAYYSSLLFESPPDGEIIDVEYAPGITDDFDDYRFTGPVLGTPAGGPGV